MLQISNIIQTEEFNRNLDDWLFKNDQKNADFFFRNKNLIPSIFRNYTGILYRGMVVDASFLEKIKKTGILFDRHTSWSKSKKVALDFTLPKNTKHTKEINIRILLEKRISTSDQLLDIHGFINFRGMEELEASGIDETSLDSAIKEEVLVGKNIKISNKEFTFL